MLKHITFAVFAISVLAAIPIPGQEPRQDRIRLLIVDGQNNHDWPRATKILKEILEGSGLFAVDVSTSPPADAPEGSLGQVAATISPSTESCSATSTVGTCQRRSLAEGSREGS